jgi:hypothetical protein
MQIKTIEEGYNSGRAYYIRSESSSCQQDIAELKALSRSARVRADKRTRFEHNQLQVKGYPAIRHPVSTRGYFFRTFSHSEPCRAGREDGLRRSTAIYGRRPIPTRLRQGELPWQAPERWEARYSVDTGSRTQAGSPQVLSPRPSDPIVSPPIILSIPPL